MINYSEKRVLHISSHHTWRGGEQQVSYLIQGLRSFNCLQWVLCADGNAMEAYCEQNGIPHYSYEKVFRKSFKNQRILKDICERHNIDIIHVHDSHSHTLAFMAALFGNERPVVVSRRVDFPLKDNYFSKRKYNHPVIKKYISVSHKIKEILEEGVENKPIISVVHSGIDPEKFNPNHIAGILRKEFRIDPNKAIIGNVAAIADHKDYFTFVDTAELLIKKGLNVHFLIVGEGDLNDTIKKYISDKELQRHITMTGFRNDIASILPEFDVFLFTSKTEGLGTSILDAFACKVPVVTTNAGGIPEIVNNEFNGLMTEVGNSSELADNVVRVLENNDLRNTIINNALKSLQNFSVENMTNLTYGIYNEIFYNVD